MAEQFAFQQRLGQGGAVDGHELSYRLLAGGMHRTGHLFLAGARFSFDEHGRVGMGDIGDQLEDRVHARILAQDVLKGEFALQFLRQRHHLILRGPIRTGPVDDQPQIVEVHRLGRENQGAHANRLQRLIDAAVAVVTITVTGKPRS